MAKYRKKPVVIEAFRWQGEEVPGLRRIAVGGDELGHQRYNLEIPTLEGTMYASEGDWIIRGVNGDLYPCKPDNFTVLYESYEPDDEAQVESEHDAAIRRIIGGDGSEEAS